MHQTLPRTSSPHVSVIKHVAMSVCKAIPRSLRHRWFSPKRSDWMRSRVPELPEAWRIPLWSLQSLLVVKRQQKARVAFTSSQLATPCPYTPTDITQNTHDPVTELVPRRRTWQTVNSQPTQRHQSEILTSQPHHNTQSNAPKPKLVRLVLIHAVAIPHTQRDDIAVVPKISSQSRQRPWTFVTRCFI